jgi:general stress protein 26
MAESDVGRVWELMRKIGMCMLSTLDNGSIRARPMAAHLEQDENRIYFLTDADSHKDEDIAQNPHVGLAFADASAQKYVSVTGRATISNDREKVRELWSVWAKAWWDSPEDPKLRILTVEPDDAQYWDSPGTVVSYAKMAAAALTNSRPDVGENRKVAL